jgi:hypothetical protein
MRGRISFIPYRVWTVPRAATVNPPTRTNSTNTASATVRLPAHIAWTLSSPVRSGVASTVAPSTSSTGARPVAATNVTKSAMALRTWPGTSYQAGSPLPGAGVGIGCGDGLGTAGVAGADGAVGVLDVVGAGGVVGEVGAGGDGAGLGAADTGPASSIPKTATTRPASTTRDPRARRPVLREWDRPVGITGPTSRRS